MASVTITSFFTKSGVPATDIETSSNNTYPIVRIYEAANTTFVGQFLMIPVQDGANDDGLYKYDFTDASGYDQTKGYIVRTDGGPTLASTERYQAGEIDPVVTLDIPTANQIADAVWNENIYDHQSANSAGNTLISVVSSINNIDANVTNIQSITSNTSTTVNNISNTVNVINSNTSSIATANQIADAVWDEQKADHLIVGSTGEALSQIKADTTAITEKLYLDVNSVQEVVHLLLKFEAGRTRIDPTANTLTVFDTDCTTPLRVFDLLNASGTSSSTEVCERKPTVKGTGDNTTITNICP